MDNVTHSLVGIALADSVMGKRMAGTQRPMIVGAAMIAANLPDIDLAYSAITPAPLGYLLHHRGHTHTVLGLGVLAAIMFVAYVWFPGVRKMRAIERLQFWLLVALALASHLLLDALNTYGVHPFYPADNRWFYGDALFIFEPALWVVLGVAAVWGARSRATRLLVAAPLTIILFTIASSALVPLESIIILALVAAVLIVAMRGLSARARGVFAIGSTIAIAVGMIAISRVARAEVAAVLAPEVRGRVMDIVLTPNPASPLCWGAMVIEVNERAGQYRVWRGSLSLAPRWRAPADCASHRIFGSKTGRVLGAGVFALRDEIQHPIADLRARVDRDCWVRAWMRFGRVPVIEKGYIYDLRFANPQLADSEGLNFSHMRLIRRPTDPVCPSFVPGWAMPREDVLK